MSSWHETKGGFQPDPSIPQLSHSWAPFGWSEFELQYPHWLRAVSKCHEAGHCAHSELSESMPPTLTLAPPPPTFTLTLTPAPPPLLLSLLEAEAEGEGDADA